MSRLWLVRHGPTHAKAMVGWTDLPADLSDRRALARLRALLPDAPVVTSDLRRAVETGDALAPRTRLPPLPALRELHFGAWEGLTWDEAAQADPALARSLLDHPGEVRPPGGESWNAMERRVNHALDRLAASFAQVIVVAHFGPITAAVARAAGLSPVRAMGLRIAPLSVSEIDLGPAGGPMAALRIGHRP